MKLKDIADGTSIFVDANIFVYAFAPHVTYGLNCTSFLERLEKRQVLGFTSSLVISDVAHRLMSLEACSTFQWNYAGIASSMKKHPTEVKQLTRYQLAITNILKLGIQVLPVDVNDLLASMKWTAQFGTLMNDSLILEKMEQVGLKQLASHDTDFDRIPSITRFTAD